MGCINRYVVVSFIIYSITTWVVHYNTPGWEEVIRERKEELGDRRTYDNGYICVKCLK